MGCFTAAIANSVPLLNSLSNQSSVAFFEVRGVPKEASCWIAVAWPTVVERYAMRRTELPQVLPSFAAVFGSVNGL
jgi:hypothetical protein